MIKITINRQEKEIKYGTMLVELLVEYDPPYAIMLNNKFINRNLYKSQLINQGDSIEIVVPMQGG